MVEKYGKVNICPLARHCNYCRRRLVSRAIVCTTFKAFNYQLLLQRDRWWPGPLGVEPWSPEWISPSLSNLEARKKKAHFVTDFQLWAVIQYLAVCRNVCASSKDWIGSESSSWATHSPAQHLQLLSCANEFQQQVTLTPHCVLEWLRNPECWWKKIQMKKKKIRLHY